MMKTLGALLIAAAAIGFTAPASAQVYIGAGDVGVRIGNDHDRYNRRHSDRGRHNGWRSRQHVAECRTIRERTVTPRGRVIVETRRVCG